MRISRLASIPALALPLLLSGCFAISTSRRLPVPKAPALVQTAAPDELIRLLNKRWDDLQSLTASVEIQVSTFKTEKGEATDYTTIPGIILMRKPEMLRVYGRVPVIGTRMLDMVSDGKNFSLWIPHCDKVYKGSDAVKPRPADTATPAPAGTSACNSSKLTESLRPGFFFDAMVVRGLTDDEDYSVAADSETVEDATKKHLLFTPEYVLTIMHRKQGSHELRTVRVITYHREDLLPYEQDIYDAEGNLQTQVSYAIYKDAGEDKYPSVITIKRPGDGFQIVLTVNSVKENQPLKDDQFHLDIPAGTETQTLN